MAAVANIEITITGKGAHGAHPNDGIDPIVVASQIVTALADDRLAQHRADRGRGGHHRPHQRRPHLQRDPRDGADAGDRAVVQAGGRRQAGIGRAPVGYRHRGELRGDGRRGVRPRLSGDGQRRRGDPDDARRRPRGRRRAAGRGDGQPDDGRGGFRLHAASQAGQLHHAGRRARPATSRGSTIRDTTSTTRSCRSGRRTGRRWRSSCCRDGARRAEKRSAFRRKDAEQVAEGATLFRPTANRWRAASGHRVRSRPAR